MKNLEEMLLKLISQSLERQVRDTDLISIRHDDKFKLPQDFIEKAWELVDHTSLLKKMSERLEDQLVDRLVNAMAAEIATDIKQVLSVKERRENIRYLVRNNIDSLVKVDKGVV